MRIFSVCDIMLPYFKQTREIQETIIMQGTIIMKWLMLFLSSVWFTLPFVQDDEAMDKMWGGSKVKTGIEKRT